MTHIFYKLSKVQINLLRLIKDKPVHVAEYYPPVKVLIRHGLAQWEGKPGRSLKITDRGLSVLNGTI